MEKNLTILKTVFLFLFAVFFLQGCRNEDLSASSNSTTEKRAVLIRKVFPKEFQKIKNLNEKFDVSSKKLSQQSFSGKNILDGAVIDSTFAMETTDGKSISYTFAVYRNNQKDYIENLVLQKNVDDTEFKSFLYKYKRKGLIGYDANNIEVYKIETNTSSNSRMSYTDKTYSNGCYDIIVTTVDCGEGGHHTNGQYCPALGYKVPSDYVTVRNNCSGGGDNDGTDSGYPSGNTGTGGSYGNTGGGGQTATTTPVATTPKWNWGRTSVVNFLGLTSEQLNFINNSAQDEFRAQMLFFISNNGIEDPLANPSDEFLSTEVKSLGLWMVNYAMTHSDFLNSEFRNVFLNSDLDFLQWSKSFLIQNPNTSWSQFQNWFSLKKSIDIDLINELKNLDTNKFSEYIQINKDIDNFELYLQDPSFNPLDSPWLKKAREYAQKLEDWSRYLGPKAKAKAREIIDQSFVSALNATAKELFNDVDKLNESQKQYYFQTDGKKGVAILLFEFANGLGLDRRDFPYDYNMTQQFLQGKVTGDIRSDFLDKLSKNGLTYSQFVANGNMIKGGYSFSPDHTTVEDSFNKHIKANWVQFFIGGANAEYYPTNENGWIKVIIWNPTSRNSLMLHQGDNYERDGSGNNLPLSTIKQYFTFKLKIY